MAEIHVAAWRSAYRGKMPDEFLDRLNATRMAESWEDQLAGAGTNPRQPDGVADPDHLVAVVDNRVLGISTVGEDRGRPGTAHSELWMINIDARYWGTDVSPRLLAECVDRLRAHEWSDVILWVLDTNARARRFYEQWGWTADGATKTEEIGGAPITEVRYSLTFYPTN